MANTNTEDLSNKNISKPLIRTMEDDLRLLKANPSSKTAAPAAKPFVIIPAAKIAAKPDDGLKKTPVNFAPLRQDDQASNKTRQDDKDREKEKERLIQIEAERELEKIRKKNEEFKREKARDEQIKKEKERAEKERIQKEKERLAQIEAEKELEKIRKKDEELRIQKEKEEQARTEKEEIEKTKKEKEKTERERRRKEKERLAQIEAEKEAERQRKRDEELRMQREKEDQIRKEKEMIEQAKREEAMKIRKKLADEIKKEMEEEIVKEKEKAEQVKIDMELEIKKEIEEAEAIKRERESAMKKRVAKVIREEMDAEIEKEKERAEQIKKEAEIEIKKEMEEELEKEKELEKVIKEEMAIDMRKEIAEQIKKDKDKDESKSTASQPKEESGIATPKKEENISGLSGINPSLKPSEPAVKMVDVPVNLPISHIHSLNDSGIGQVQVSDEEKKIKQLLNEEELEILRKKDEELRKEKEIAEQLKRDKDNLEKIVREQEAIVKERIQKENIVQSETRKEIGIKKESAIAPEVKTNEIKPKDKNIFAFKNAWQDSPLNSEFFTDAPKTAPSAVSAPAQPPASIPAIASQPASIPAPDPIHRASPASLLPRNLPKEPILPSFEPAEPGLEKSVKPPLDSNFKPAEPGLNKSIKPPVDFSPKKKLSSFPAENSFGPKPGRKTAKKQYFELSGEYEHLSPEMRLAQQGFSSLSADLEEGVRKDAELLDQDLALKKKVAASSASSVPGQLKNIQVPAEGSLKREPAPVFKTVLKIAALVLLVAGLFYGTYYFVFKRNPAANIPVSSQPVLAGMKEFGIALDFNSNAMPEIKEYVKNNAASAENVSRIIIKDKAGGKTLKISDFGKVLGVIMPAKFLDNLLEDYDLVVFNYPKNNYLRMGMVLKVKDAELAAVLAKEWEPAMFIGTNSFLFDASGYYDNSKSFGAGSYKNASIRYLPLGKNNLALNYMVDKNKNLFIFATSQDDIHYLIDELEK